METVKYWGLVYSTWQNYVSVITELSSFPAWGLENKKSLLHSLLFLKFNFILKKYREYKIYPTGFFLPGTLLLPWCEILQDLHLNLACQCTEKICLKLFLSQLFRIPTQKSSFRIKKLKLEFLDAWRSFSPVDNQWKKIGQCFLSVEIW